MTDRLAFAIENGNLEMIKTLIADGVDVCKQSSLARDSYLMIAFNHFYRKNIKFLIQLFNILLSTNRSKELVNLKNIYENTILYYVSKEGRKEIVEILLRHGADINARNAFGYTALQMALKSWENSFETAHFLLSQNANPNIYGGKIEESPLWYLSDCCELPEKHELMRMMLRRGANPNLQTIKDDYPLLFSVIKSNDIKTTEILLRAGANLNIKGKRRLFLLLNGIIYRKHNEILSLLIQFGIDVNMLIQEYHSLIYYAICEKNLPAIKILLDGGAKIDDISSIDGDSLIHAIFKNVSWYYDDDYKNCFKYISDLQLEYLRSLR